MTITRVVPALTLLLAAQVLPSMAASFAQVNLVSNLSTVGAVTVDPNLVNPWGLAFSGTSPFWVSNEGSNTATLYNGVGVKTNLTPAVAGGPTGQVFNSAGAGNFLVNGSASTFIFDTLAGGIAGWNGGNTATTILTTPNAVYTGLALGSSGTSNLLYAANFTSGGGINVFDSNFNQLNSSTFMGKFVDPNLPSGYAPFNIQQIGNNLYVEYAEIGNSAGNPTRGAGLGIVDEYDLNGNLVKSLITSGGQLDAPWGVTVAPGGFGQYSGDVLVGNFGNGTINVFDPNSGAYLGTLDDANGNPIVNQDLWALDFRSSSFTTGVSEALYFDAGIGGQKDGLFGYIDPTPEPSTYGLAALGSIMFLGVAVARRRATRHSA